MPDHPTLACLTAALLTHFVNFLLGCCGAHLNYGVLWKAEPQGLQQLRPIADWLDACPASWSFSPRTTPKRTKVQVKFSPESKVGLLWVLSVCGVKWSAHWVTGESSKGWAGLPSRLRTREGGIGAFARPDPEARETSTLLASGFRHQREGRTDSNAYCTQKSKLISLRDIRSAFLKSWGGARLRVLFLKLFF
jgi:hypothetical protein